MTHTHAASAPLLPDEIVKEILSPLFHVPDALFRNNSPELSPFSAPSEHSCSTHLTVCKQWMRVATPLLYEVVILRSRPQAVSLERALRKSPEFGRLVKRLRLEGGFGAVMGKILPLTPNVEGLCLSLNLFSTDNASGLVKALHLINPTHVVLIDSLGGNVPENQYTRALCCKLSDCIRQWADMECFDFPYENAHFRINRGGIIAQALSHSPSAQVIHVPGKFDANHIRFMSANANLKRIYVRGPSSLPFPSITCYSRREVEADARLKMLVVYDENYMDAYTDASDDEPMVVKSLNPSYTPMLAASEEEKERIWNRIFAFALGCDISSPKLHLHANTEEVLQPVRSGELKRTCLSLARVSKLFQRIAKPYLFYAPRFRSDFPQALMKFAQVLRESPSLAMHIHFITISMVVFGRNALDSERQETMQCALISVLGLATNLVYFRQFGCWNDRVCWTWDVIDAFDGSRLVHLLGLTVCAPYSAAAFTTMAKFKSLEKLHLHCPVSLYLKSKIPRISLPKLEAIVYSSKFLRDTTSPVVYCFYGDIQPQCSENNANWHASLLDILSLMDLPSLRSFMVDQKPDIPQIADAPDVQAFVTENGTRLYDVKLPLLHSRFGLFSICERLRLLIFDFTDHRDLPTPSLLRCKHKYTSLRKLVFNHVVEHKSNTNAWHTFFNALDLSAFPSLQELQVPACKWPTNEREIRKGNVWLARSARLKKEFNVQLTDGDGVHWTPRLGMR